MFAVVPGDGFSDHRCDQRYGRSSRSMRWPAFGELRST